MAREFERLSFLYLVAGFRGFHNIILVRLLQTLFLCFILPNILIIVVCLQELIRRVVFGSACSSLIHVDLCGVNRSVAFFVAILAA